MCVKAAVATTVVTTTVAVGGINNSYISNFINYYDYLTIKQFVQVQFHTPQQASRSLPPGDFSPLLPLLSSSWGNCPISPPSVKSDNLHSANGGQWSVTYYKFSV